MKQFDPSKQFKLKTPCKNCPFLKPSLGEPYNQLAKGRMLDIINNMQDGTFHCHKTLDKPKNERQHCAGAIAVGLKKHGELTLTNLAYYFKLIEPDHYNEAFDMAINPEDLK